MADPLQWHMVHKTEWAKYLMSSEAPGSAAAKKEIVKAANRFMLWLHDRRPGEVPPLKFQPLTKAVLKKVTADRQTHGEARVPTMIKDEHWAIIRCKLPTSVKPFALLAYHYGLRRSETLGLELKDVKLGYLRVERQLETFADSTPSFGPLKGREARKVPHWFSTPSEVHDLITLAVSERVHPDTLTDRWTELMNG
ncbi:MAG: hypothetical protein EOP09_09330 [Proteobacteria bacterium]|nr:MAG: hypothetical protein EOP09_09330 [Pseudomonadota bacterium]